ncbi:MAG: isoprenylcysteine carboxylmethyltransferase family protein [Desulfobacterales bacterium]|nr:isoprenylcysteine carboxylmethyltransferase family protein [Desulfobacterales bacterium]
MERGVTMWWAFIRALLILPGSVLVLVPAVILTFTGVEARFAEPTLAGIFFFWAGMACATVGVALAAWCTALFLRRGRGTPAPWDPPRVFVVAGPYRHVRNPMIIGVLLILAAEALLFRSWALAAWWAVFLAGNALYIPLVEEPGMVKRFGDDYRAYRARVPRWLPRRA